jgi:hypothetical protein
MVLEWTDNLIRLVPDGEGAGESRGARRHSLRWPAVSRQWSIESRLFEMTAQGCGQAAAAAAAAAVAATESGVELELELARRIARERLAAG